MDFFDTMMSFGKGLLTDLISTAIVIPLVTFMVVKFFQSFRAARIWWVRTKLGQVLEPRNFPTIVMSTSSIYVGKNNYTRPQTGIGQVRAITRFAGTLAAAYRRSMDTSRVVFSEEIEISSAALRDDLIIVGGPKTNAIGREILEGPYLKNVLPKDFYFKTAAHNELGIVEKKKNRRTHLSEGSNQSDTLKLGKIWRPETEDDAIGMVLRCRNPFSQNDRVLTYVAGLGTFATEAAAMALVECKPLRSAVPLSARWWKSKSYRGRRSEGYIAVIKAKLSGEGNSRSVADVQILYTRGIPWAQQQYISPADRPTTK